MPPSGLGSKLTMPPDICTSISCNAADSYCPECSHALFRGQGTDSSGKFWRWTFSPRFGPLFVDKDDMEIDDQPVDENDPAWDIFEVWYEQHKEKV